MLPGPGRTLEQSDHAETEARFILEERRPGVPQNPDGVPQPEAQSLYEALIEEDESGKHFLTRDKNGVVSPFRLFL